MTELSDADLVRQVQRGDTAGYARLVERHYPGCLRYAERMLGDRADAEEVVQDTFVRAYRALGRYDDRGRFRAWLFRILVNRCRSSIRQRVRDSRIFVPYEAVNEQVDSVPPDAGCWSAAVQRALDTLSPALREALLLRCVEDLSYDEIATMTGAGVSAVKMRVMRAREQMRGQLQEKQNA